MNIAGMAGKAVVNRGLDRIKRENANAKQNAPLDNTESHLRATPEKGLVSSLVHWVHKGSVIDANWGSENNVVESELHQLIAKTQQGQTESLNGQGAEGGREGGEQLQEQGTQKPKVVIHPITLKDFEDVIGKTKGFLGNVNKGYVRFAKTPEGGLKLEKVGNKCGYFINSRINVTPEHNREMRRLFADVLFAEWGGSDRFGVEKDYYGAKIAEVLGQLRTKILNGANSNSPGAMLSREEIKGYIETYNSIFSADSKVQVCSTFLSMCLKGVEYSDDDVVKPTVDDFIAKYGEKLEKEPKTKAAMEALIKSAENATQLRAAMMTIADQFEAMNVHWKNDREVRVTIDNLTQSLTTGHGSFSDKQVENLGGFLIRQLEAEKFPGAKGDIVTKFNEKILPSYLRVARFEYTQKVMELKAKFPEGSEELKTGLGNAVEDLRKKLSLETLSAEAKKFFEAFTEHAKSVTADNAVQQVKDLLNVGKQQIIADLEEKTCLEYVPEQDVEPLRKEAEEKLANINRQLEYLNDPANTIGKRLDEFLKETNDYFVIEKDETADKTKWSEGELRELIGGLKDVLTQDFADELFMMKYAGDAYKVTIDHGDGKGKQPVNFGFWDDKATKALNAVIDNMTNRVDTALKQNLQSKDDISLSELCGKMADFILESNVRDDLKNSSFTVDLNGEKKMSVKITVEHLMKLFVDKAVERKLGKNEAYLKTGREMAQKLSTILEELRTNIAKFDPNKLPELTRYYCDLRGFSRIAVIEEQDLFASKKMQIEDLSREVQITMLEKFLDEDLNAILDTKDVKEFKDEVDTALKMRLSETVAETTERAVDRFYRGTLNFGMGEGHDTSLKDVRLEEFDSATGFTNVRRVEDAFIKKINAFDFQERIEAEQAKLPYHPINFTELRGKLVRRAETLWQNEVVHNAPGRGFSDSIDWVVYKFKKTFNMNRFKDITDKWIDARATNFEKQLGKMVDRYFAFEQKFVGVCRNRVETLFDPLLKQAEPWEKLSPDELKKRDDKVQQLVRNARSIRAIRAMRDPEERERLLNDVLAGFQKEMEKALERYIKTPTAFAKLEKDGKAFARFVDDALGILPRGDNVVTDMSGFATFTTSLDTTMKAREDIVKIWTDGKDSSKLAAGLFAELSNLASNEAQTNELPTKQRDFLKMLLDSKNASEWSSQLLNWASEKLAKDVLEHPLDFYRSDKEGDQPGHAFVRNLARQLLGSMTKQFAGYDKAVKQLKEKLGCAGFGGETFFAQAAGLIGTYVSRNAEKLKQNKFLHQLVFTEEKAAYSNFAEKFAALNPNIIKDGNERRKMIEDIVSATTTHFSTVMELAESANAKKVDDAFEGILKAYNAKRAQIEKSFATVGVLPSAVTQFGVVTDLIFKSEYLRLEGELTSGMIVNAKQATEEAALAIGEKVEKFYQKCMDTFKSQHLLWSDDGITDVFGAMGIKSGEAGYKDESLFRTVLDESMASEIGLEYKVAVNMNQTGLVSDLAGILGVKDEVLKSDDFIRKFEINFDRNIEVNHLQNPTVMALGASFAASYHQKSVDAAKSKVMARALELANKIARKTSSDNPDVHALDEQDIPALEEHVRKVMGDILTAREASNVRSAILIGGEPLPENLTLDKINAKIGRAVNGTLMVKDAAKFNCEDFDTIDLTQIDKSVNDRIAELKLERARQSWLDANFNLVLEKLYSEIPELALNQPDVSPAEQSLIDVSRIYLSDRLVEFLRDSMLKTGTPDEWDNLLFVSKNRDEVAIDSKPEFKKDVKISGFFEGRAKEYVGDVANRIHALHANAEGLKTYDRALNQIEARKPAIVERLGKQVETMLVQKAVMRVINPGTFSRNYKLNEKLNKVATANKWDVSTLSALFDTYLKVSTTRKKKTLKAEEVKEKINQVKAEIDRVIGLTAAWVSDRLVKAMANNENYALPQEVENDAALDKLIGDVYKDLSGNGIERSLSGIQPTVEHIELKQAADMVADLCVNLVS